MPAAARFLLPNKPATPEADGVPAEQADAAVAPREAFPEVEPAVASPPVPVPDPVLVELASPDGIFTDVDPTLIHPSELDSVLSARHLGVYRIVQVNAD